MLTSNNKKSFSALEIKANYTCNSQCIYCCAGNRNQQRTMTYEEIVANVDFFIDTYSIAEVCLSGGEPTVHPSFLSNLAFIRDRGLKTYLHTNAIKFHNSDLVKTCVPLTDRVLVGLSFHDADMCDYLTGTGASFNKRLSGIAHLLDAGVPLRTNTVILKDNYQFLPAIARVVSSCGVSRGLLTFPFFFEFSPQQVAQFVPPSFEAVQPYLSQAIDILTDHDIEVSLQGLPPCKLGKWKELIEFDPDRALVDSSHQLSGHSMLFSKTLGYFRDVSCEHCEYADKSCWGHPKPGALGIFGDLLGLPGG